MEYVQFAGQWLATCWRFFTDINVPGFDFSFAVLFVGLFLASFGLSILFMILGLRGSVGSYGSSRAGKVKISKARQHDER